MLKSVLFLNSLVTAQMLEGAKGNVILALPALSNSLVNEMKLSLKLGFCWDHGWEPLRESREAKITRRCHCLLESGSPMDFALHLKGILELL